MTAIHSSIARGAIASITLVSALSLGCGTHGALLDRLPSTDAAVRDGAIARDAIALPDASPVADVTVAPMCPAGSTRASAVGLSQLGRFDLRFAWAGYEHFGSHACPKLVVRFTATDDLRSNERLDVTVTYANSASTNVLGTHMATIEHTLGDRTAMITAPVRVDRADGLSSRFDAGAFLNSINVSLHIATWDIEASVVDASTCPPFFAICL